MRWIHAPVSALVLLCSLPASAGDIPCAPVQPGTIQLDGLLSDWKGADGVGVDRADQVVRGRKGWSGPQDLSFDLYCNHDAHHLFLAVNVKDEYFVRVPKARHDDHLVVHLGRARLVIFPGDLKRLKSKVLWGRRRARGVRVAEALQQGGYSVEIAIPFRRIPGGFRKGAPAVPGAVWVFDCDSKARLKTETVMGTARSPRRGRFAFSQAMAELRAFLEAKGYSASQIRVKKNADVVGGRGVEQVLLVGRTIGIVGDELPGGAFFYLDLPVKRPRDVYWLKLRDLNGDGKMELLTRHVERSGNGRRELISVYRFTDANKFTRSFAHEIFKGQGKRTIINRYRLERRRRTRRSRRGVDIIVDRPRARGFTKDTYREAKSTDAYPVLLPWEEPKKRHFRFEGEEFFQK